MDGNELFILSQGSQTHGVAVNPLHTGAPEQAWGCVDGIWPYLLLARHLGFNQFALRIIQIGPFTLLFRRRMWMFTWHVVRGAGSACICDFFYSHTFPVGPKGEGKAVKGGLTRMVSWVSGTWAGFPMWCAPAEHTPAIASALHSGEGVSIVPISLVAKLRCRASASPLNLPSSERSSLGFKSRVLSHPRLAFFLLPQGSRYNKTF